MAVQPSNKPRIGLKLHSNAFQTIPELSLFDTINCCAQFCLVSNAYFSAFLARLLRSYHETYLAKRFPTKFCFRCTYDQLRRTKAHDGGTQCAFLNMTFMNIIKTRSVRRWQRTTRFNVVVCLFRFCCNMLSIYWICNALSDLWIDGRPRATWRMAITCLLSLYQVV